MGRKSLSKEESVAYANENIKDVLTKLRSTLLTSPEAIQYMAKQLRRAASALDTLAYHLRVERRYGTENKGEATKPN